MTIHAEQVLKLVVRFMGANINRRTAENIKRAGLKLRNDHRLSTIFRLMIVQR